MNAIRDLLLSVGLHAALGAIVLGVVAAREKSRVEAVPFFFEVLPEALSDAPAAPRPARVPRERPTLIPRDSGPSAPETIVPAVAVPAAGTVRAPEVFAPSDPARAAAARVLLPDPAPPVPTFASATSEQVPSQPSEQAQVVSPPRAQGRLVPVYPRAARRKGWEGRVVLEVGVSASGAVETVRVVASSGFVELDAAAESAVRRAVFAPARLGVQAVADRILLPFEFRLRK